MDIDISDILADVSRPLPTSSHPHQQQHTPSDSSAYVDHQLLVRAWTSERCSPALLPYPTALMERTMQRVAAQIRRVEDLTSSVPNGEPNAYDGSRTGGEVDELSRSKNLNLILSILQTDLSRTQFIVRSFLRQRLAKLTKFAVFYLQQLQRQEQRDRESQTSQLKSKDSAEQLLSESEKKFLQHHHVLLSQLYGAAFLDSFPTRMRRLDDSSGGVGNGMVDGPDEGGAVVVRCLMKEGWGNEGEVERGRREGEEGASTVELRMRRGEVWVVRWQDVKTGVVDGSLELL